MMRGQSAFTNPRRNVCYAAIRLLLAAASLLFVPKGAAAPVEEESETSKVHIAIISNLSTQADIHPLEQSIVSQLVDFNVDIDFHHLTTLPPASDDRDSLATMLMAEHDMAAAFIIYETESHVGLRILLKTGDRLETTNRTIDVAPGTPFHEAIAVIVRATTITAIKREREKQRTPSPKAAAALPAEAAPQETVAHEPRPENKMQRLYIETGGAMGLYSRKTPLWLGLPVGLGWQPIRHLNLHIGYMAFSKIRTSAYDLTLTLERHPIRLGVEYFRPLNRFWWGGGVSIDIDYIKERISTRNARFALAPEEASVHPALICYLLLGIQLFAPLSLVLSVGAEIPLNNTKYHISTLTGEKALLEPFPVQPIVTLGLRFHFF
jgi:hypothetical protein